MQKISVALTILFLFSLCIIDASFSATLTLEEDRRIEEEKREELRPSEIQPPWKKEVRTKPLAPIDIVYFVELVPKKITYRYDACKVLVVLLGIEDQYIDLDSQVTFLEENNLIPEKYINNFRPTEPLRKGLAAYMFCKALDVKGGLYIRLLGPNERHALKELTHEGIMYSGNVNDIITGQELIQIFVMSTTYLTKKKE